MAVPISTATGVAGRPIRVGSHAFYLAVTPDGRTVYVPNENSDTVTPISTTTNRPGEPIKVGYSPQDIAILP